MVKFIKRLLLIILLGILPTCKMADAEAVQIRGGIDENFLESLRQIEFDNSVIVVSSWGGSSSIAYEASKIIDDFSLNIVIRDLCISACAEYLLPTANSITFEGNPIIGYHWNPIIVQHLLEKNATRDIEFCDTGAEELIGLASRSGINRDYWISILDRIILKYYRVDYIPGKCPWSAREFEHRLWLPNSEQLKSLIGLDFEGSVCADNPDECSDRLSRLWSVGDSFVIGDQSIVLN